MHERETSAQNVKYSNYTTFGIAILFRSLRLPRRSRSCTQDTRYVGQLQLYSQAERLVAVRLEPNIAATMAIS